MQISSVSYNPNFNGVERLRLKNGSTLVVNASRNDKGKLGNLSSKVWYKGKTLKETNYNWKRGIDIERFDGVAGRLCKDIGLSKTEENIDRVSNTIWGAFMEDGDRFIGDV